MFKRTVIATSVALAITALPAVAQEEEGSFLDEWEIAGELKNESAVFTSSGQTIGQATTTTDTTTKHDSGDLYKSESSAKLYVNGDVGEEGSTFHAELNLRYDTEGISGYKGAKSYSQHDLLRELYIDTEVGNEDNPVSIRAGKQQVVWGTADGIKLLDIINPTDWREFAQNTMEDSRIPVWMINAETDLENGGNLQFVLSQSEHNKIPGMDTENGETRAVVYSYGGSPDNSQLKGTAAEHPFMMKGVDTIVGKVNGFFNIGAAMGQVTDTFYNGGFTNPANGNSPFYSEAAWATANSSSIDFDGDTVNNEASALIAPPEITTVSNFADGFTSTAVGTLGLTSSCGGAGSDGADCLESFTEMSNQNITNLFDNADGDYDSSVNPNSMWEYMPNATFATFNAFVDMSTKYVRNHPDDADLNLGGRYKSSLDNGLNYSLNYFYNYDPNPVVEVSWQNSSGEVLQVVDETSTHPQSGSTLHILQLKDSGGTYYGADVDFAGSYESATDVSNGAVNPATFVFTETLNRIHNLGTSMDYSLDTESMGPVVLRGEFLYQKDVMTPVINRTKLGYGHLTDALKMEKGDYFKYVLGADINVLTNMMVSGQFIQLRNLDYISEGSSLSDTTWRYTADQSAMHLSNGFQKAEENKEFYSLFLSKPFGAEQQHRWNNIFMFEENGGKWNRFDVEYSFDDELIGTAEYNKYWGDQNTQFGQMEKSSNFQLGLKYLF